MPVFSAPRISVHAGVVAVRVNIFLGEAEDALDLESRASEDSLTQFIDVGSVASNIGSRILSPARRRGRLPYGSWNKSVQKPKGENRKR